MASMNPFEPGASSDAVIDYLRGCDRQGRNNTRHEMALKKEEMRANRHGAFVLEQLQEKLDEETLKDLSPFVHAATNMLVQAAWQRAMNYDRAARRMVAKRVAPDGETQEEGAPTEGAPGQEALDLILSFDDRDCLMGQVELLSTIHEAVIVWSVVRGPRLPTGDLDPARRDEWRLDHEILTPANVKVIVDPECQTRAIAYYWSVFEKTGELDKDGNEATRERIVLWTATHWMKLDLRDNVYVEGPIPHNTGRLPFAVFRVALPSGSFFIEGNGDDLFDATIEACVGETWINHAIEVGSFRQPVIEEGNFDDKDRKKLMGPHDAIVLPKGHMNMVSFAPEGGILQYREAINQKKDELAEKHGIPAHVFRSQPSQSATPMTGHAMKQASAKLLRDVRQRRKFLIEGELDLIDADRAVLVAHEMLEAGALPEDATIVVDPAEPEFEPTPQEQRDQDDWDLERGFISAVDIMKRANPDLSDDEAKRRILENRTVNRGLGIGARGGAGGPSPVASIMQRLAGGGAPPAAPPGAPNGAA